MNHAAAHPTRIHELLEQYWQDVRGAHALPLESDINTERLKEIWPSCFLVSVRANGSFGYNYLGEALVEAYGDDLTGREITETLVYPHPASLFATFKRVVETAAPVTDESEFTNSKGARIKYRSCVLPLAGPEGTHVRFLLGGMKWKTY